MSTSDLQKIVEHIANTGVEVKNKYCEEKDLEADYVSIFAQNEAEYLELTKLASELGIIAADTPTGFVYHLNSYIGVKPGEIKLIKIRNIDRTKPQRGYVDFITNYLQFKRKYFGKPGFNLITRTNYEMMELHDPSSDVLVYFPSTPLTEQLNIR